jgi:calcineurin-like phosphoesterase family protein
MNTFLISDTHFSHRGIVKFLREDGTKERPWDNTEEMDEALVQNWNSVVRPKDTVYHLGDVVINRSALGIVSRLNGCKILIQGNHDVFRPAEYLEHFKNIHPYKVLDNFLLSHIPVHTCSIERWSGNIHGHLHSRKVLAFKANSWTGGGKMVGDKRYLCVSVEQTGYTPISLEDAKLKLNNQ